MRDNFLKASLLIVTAENPSHHHKILLDLIQRIEKEKKEIYMSVSSNEDGRGGSNSSSAIYKEDALGKNIEMELSSFDEDGNKECRIGTITRMKVSFPNDDVPSNFNSNKNNQSLLDHKHYVKFVDYPGGWYNLSEMMNKDLFNNRRMKWLHNNNVDDDDDDNDDDNDDDDDDGGHRDQCRVVVAGDAHWTTQLVAMEPADAFRIDMTTADTETVCRGKPMVVKVRIFNLSLESRNLMLLIAKKESKPSMPENIAVKEEAVNAAVVSEANGYTFGVWGISASDNGTVQLNRDHELLAIDTALVLGDLQGQHAVDAELRFVPLRSGRLKVPNFKLYDKAANRWYNYTHDFCIVAV